MADTSLSKNIYVELVELFSFTVLFPLQYYYYKEVNKEIDRKNQNLK